MQLLQRNFQKIAAQLLFFTGRLKGGFVNGWFWECTLVPVFVPGEHANVPSFGFRSGGTSEGTLVPVFVPGEHTPKPPFLKPPFWEPPSFISEEKGLFPPFSGYSGCSSGPPEKGEKGRKRAKKADFGRVFARGMLQGWGLVGNGPNTVSGSTVSNTELSESFGAH